METYHGQMENVKQISYIFLSMIVFGDHDFITYI